MRQNISPAHDALRRAVRWLSDYAPATPASINAASVRFDLSPQDEQFLLTHFLDEAGARAGQPHARTPRAPRAPRRDH